jgi:anion-transporting  ArsA/GET3 family ATPase
MHFDPVNPQIAIYNMPFLFRLAPSSHTLSVTQLRQALHLLVMKHLSLRTALRFDTDHNQLMQHIIPLDHDQSLFTLIESTFSTEEELNQIMYNEKRNSQIFHLAQGLVFRCHLVYHETNSSHDLLTDQDALIFNFHHALFDFPSMDIFLRDLDQAYTSGHLDTGDELSLRYLDCEYSSFDVQPSISSSLQMPSSNKIHR